MVKTKFFEFGDLVLESAKKLSLARIAYETYGQLNEEKSNAILICHPLSGDAHAAGKHKKTDRKNGWYDIAIGPGKTFDTNKYFIICSNIIGGCKGSTGPSSINTKTGKPYGLEFPLITVGDMVKAQKKLIDHLGIKKLFCVTGGSLGGMQVLQWTIDYPEAIYLAIPIATSLKQYPLGIAFHDIGRKIILQDKNWNNGSYYDQKKKPEITLSLARQIGHITYLSQDILERKFGRRKKREKIIKNPNQKFGIRFEIQSYLDYKGKSFVRRFDANSYLYITQAIDQFDLTNGGKIRSKDIFKNVKAKFLLVSFTSDWLYPPEQVEEVVTDLAEVGVPTVYRKLDLPYGHDSFLIYNNTLGNVLVNFLEKEAKEYFH